MKRAIIFGVSLLVSFVVASIGYVQHHPVLLNIGIVFGSAVALAILVAIVKVMWRFITHSLTSIVFVSASLVVVGCLSWYDKVNSFIGFMVGFGLGAILLLLLFRKLGTWAQTSLIIGEVFSFLSAYKVRSYLTKRDVVDRDTQIVYNVDYKNIVLVLKQQMGYSNKEAKSAASYAVESTDVGTPLEDKIKMALSYLSNNNIIYKASDN